MGKMISVRVMVFYRGFLIEILVLRSVMGIGIRDRVMVYHRGFFHEISTLRS